MNVVQTVQEHLSAGHTAPEIIAVKTGLPLQEVRAAVRDIKVQPQRTNVEVLRDNLALLQQLLDTATWEYRAMPTLDNASAITQMINTSLTTIKEIESRKDPADLMNEVLAKVVQPLFRAFIVHVTTETNRAREALQDGVPKDFHARIDDALKGLVKNVGRITSTDYADTVRHLAETIGCKPEDERVRMLRPVESNDERTGTE